MSRQDGDAASGHAAATPPPARPGRWAALRRPGGRRPALRLRSFRLRIALSSTATALAAILLLYAAASLTIVTRRANIIDRMLSAHLAGPGLHATPAALWPATDAQLNASFSGFVPDGASAAYAILRVEHAQQGLVYRSAGWPAGLADAAPPPAGQAPEPAAGQPGGALGTVEQGGQSWRLGRATRGPVTVWLGVNRSLSDAQVRASLGRFGAAIAVLAALIGALAWYLAGRAMRPVQHLTGVMLKLKASELDQRVSAADEDLEFAQLVTVFNAMLDRLERGFLQAARFSGDAAHELRTPLTILQGELERAFAAAAEQPQLEQGLANMLDEVRRLDSIVRKLLLLARADAGQLQIPLARLDLRPLLDDLAEDVGLLDAAREVRLDLPKRIQVGGDAELLGQVLHNLVSNAVKYGLAGGWIGLAARLDGACWHIDVANASAGIAAEHRERLFDRFYRADHAHNRRIAGVGLGLSLARDIARAHGGALVLAEAGAAAADGGGVVCFRLSLPAAGGNDQIC
ncbi:sensor histidine kinase [Rugamonas rubra]|uniref:histidine kinase n=1 Tax=Rugamonas rubra TaxID=758825 RepID=A0A1I4JRR5_9BURK|nr:ATP-binding protein [Rugamonas rubra]SFL69011.1 Signal transduction histidine kinase [Rugamonas rubra]